MPITFERLIEVIRSGIPNKEAEAVRNPVSDCYGNGAYAGRPGKDMYFVLPNLNQEQKELLAKEATKQYPKIPQIDHVGFAAFIRYLYGCFHRNGVLASPETQEKTVSMDWKIANDFCDLLESEFISQGNDYGLVVLYEMKAHRIADRAVIENDESKLCDAIRYYQKSHDLAVKIGCFKQTFSTYYWSFKYCLRFPDSKYMNDLALSLCKLMIDEVEKNCKKSRFGYVKYASECMDYLIANKAIDLSSFSCYKNQVIARACEKIVRRERTK